MLIFNDSQRGLTNKSTLAILIILYLLFFFSSALWALEVAQLIGLDGILLHPNDLSTDAKFNIFYDLIARETKITGVLFECQVRLAWHSSDILWWWLIKK